ncbi:MAG: hypothetical protein CVV44_11960 [Spirochaetae bacterium HGW-Spirochaetae-1]|nr:MAG: hypothetical protein CVV44_11960 [Spirochaetae bacterium HGW-Spirochaetae-1]
MRKFYFLQRYTVFFCMTAVFAFIPLKGYADIFNDPLSYYGGPDTMVYNSDTVMLENTVMDDASGITPVNTLSLNVAYLYSGYYMVGFLSVAWSPLSMMEINVSLPYIYRTVAPDKSDTYSKGGYGDTKLAVRFFIKDLFERIDSTTAVNVTIPTGDLAAADRLENVPLGYGNVTTGILESLSYRLPPTVTSLPFRFFMNLGTQFYTNITIEKNAAIREYYRWYFAGCGMLGMEYSFLPYLIGQVKYNIIFLPERTYEEESLVTPGSKTSLSREDRLIASDVIFAVKFMVKEYVSGNLSFILPVMELKDGSKPEDARREWKIMLSLMKNFSTGVHEKDIKKADTKKKVQRKKTIKRTR